MVARLKLMLLLGLVGLAALALGWCVGRGEGGRETEVRQGDQRQSVTDARRKRRHSVWGAPRDTISPSPPWTRFAHLPRARIQILSDRREPAGSAWVFRYSGDETVDFGSTDSYGFWTTWKIEAGTEIVVIPSGGPAERRRLQEGVDWQQVVLSEGHCLSGTIRCLGSHFVFLQVGLLPRKDDPVIAALSEADQECIPRGIHEGGKLVAHCDEKGRFRFHGLPSDFSGSLIFPDDFALIRAPDGIERAGNTLVISRPMEDLEIVIERRPALCGRVMIDGTKHPVHGALVELALASGTGQDEVRHTWSNESGRFRLHLLPTDATNYRLTVQRYSDEDSQHWEHPGVLTADIDVGDFAFPRSRTIRLRIKNAEGVAVPGAKVKIMHLTRPERSDEAGLISLRIPAYPTTLYVRAPGYREVEQYMKGGRVAADITLIP